MSHVKWNRQLGLALTLFILGTLAYWIEFKHRPEKESSEEQAKRVFQIKDTPVQTITLTGGDQHLVFSCSDFSAKLCKPGDHSKWEILEPLRLKADDGNVNAFLS